MTGASVLVTDAPIHQGVTHGGGQAVADKWAVLAFGEPGFTRQGRALRIEQHQIGRCADGQAPNRQAQGLGWAGWEAGQLESELADNAWLSCPADLQILFDIPAEQRLSAAAARLGVNLNLLTRQAGHA